MTQIKRVAVIGAGTMGRQISLQIARQGFQVVLYDIDRKALTAAEQAQREIVADWIATGRVSDTAAKRIYDHLSHCGDLASVCRDADLAIEAAPEDVELKRAVFAQLDRLLPPGAIIASNSSSIRVSKLEDASERPERVANLHFYLPVWDSPMAEVGGGGCTQPEVLDALCDFARAIDILPLRVRRESTGFVFNRVWRAVKKEVMRVADSGVASIEDIDRAWMIKFGREKPPPFAQMDRIGLDVIRDIELHYAAESGDPDDMPPPLLTERVEQGDLGVKSGRGFYEYPDPAWQRDDFLDPDAGA
jgi:3-hydroxybutyryl-CoA dehydrogenase